MNGINQTFDVASGVIASMDRFIQIMRSFLWMGSLKIFSRRSNRILFVGKKIATNFPPRDFDLLLSIIPYPNEYGTNSENTQTPSCAVCGVLKQQKWALCSLLSTLMLVVVIVLLIENFSRSRE